MLPRARNGTACNLMRYGVSISPLARNGTAARSKVSRLLGMDVASSSAVVFIGWILSLLTTSTTCEFSSYHM